MQRRTAVTLMETLVAIFILGIGLMAILTLFPLGALNMAQAIKDDRAAQVAEDADSISRAWDIRKDADVQAAFFDPDPLLPPPQKLVPTMSASGAGQSYPVYIDPIGWLQGGGAGPINRDVNFTDVHILGLPPRPAAWVGTNGTLVDFRGMPYSGIPRRSLRFLNKYPNPPSSPDGDPNLNPLANPFAAAYRSAQIQKWCTLLDDLAFNDSGVPTSPSLSSPDRDGRYSWAYLARLSDITAPRLVDLSVVVYSGRSMVLTPTGSVSGEHGYAATFTQGSKVVTVRYNPAAGEERPPIRKGVWIMDGTLVSPQLAPAPPTMVPDPHGFCYRVVNTTDLGLQNGFYFVELELQQYVRMSTSTVPDNQGFSPGYWGRLIVLENVIEVFERGSDS